MTLTKIISGGQTGADIGGLVGARRVGLQTGGTAPKGYRTDAGPQRAALRAFGLTEHLHSGYAPRTAANVREADATVLFGDTSSPGCSLTKRLCRQHHKRFIENPSAAELRAWVTAHRVVVLNVAGNRERTNPGIARRVAQLIADAFGPDVHDSRQVA